MSKELTLPTNIVPGTDITEEEMAQLQKFIEDGMPGYTKLDEPTVKKMTDLYLGGKTYSQISQILFLKKELVLFASDKYKWYPAKVIKLEELNSAIAIQLEQGKLEGKQTIINLAQANQKFINDKLAQYHRTGNEAFYLAIDKGEIDKLLKLQEAMVKPMVAPVSAPVSPVGLNVGEGVNMAKEADGSISITPTQSLSEKMRAKVQEKREQERLEKEATELKKRSDISIEETKTDKGESNES